MLQTSTTSGLVYLVREPQASTDHPPVLFLLHGLGSNEADLFSLVREIPEEFLVICVRATVDLGGGRYAWYRVDFSTGKPVYDFAEVEESAKRLAALVSEVRETYQTSDRVYVGGFSQGGILSYVLGLTRPELLQGIVVLSGRLLAEVRSMVASTEKLPSLRVFVAHGTHDTMLPIEYAREATAFLQSLGINPAYKEYAMGHSIDTSVLADVRKWLNVV